MLTHGCIGPTHPFHIKPCSICYTDRIGKYGYSAIFGYLYEIFLYLNVLAGILAQTCGL